MHSHTACGVRAAAFRNRCLSLAKTCSIGFRSGEYFGKNNILAPACLIIWRTALLLWLPRLSATIFAKILRGELPCHKIYEDDHTLAFMDVMPRCDGHCLVIPKQPSRNLFDIDSNDLAHLMTSVQKVMTAAKTAFEADGITIQQFNEPAAGQVVFHTHIHILPRHDGIRLGHHTGEMADNDELAEHAAKIIAALP